MRSTGVHAFSGGSQAGITVTVQETGQSTTTDGSGRFMLTGLPSGSVTLHFQGAGIDATLVISGLSSGQTLTLTIQVSGSQANVVPDASPSPGASPSPSPSPSASPSPNPSPSPSPNATCFAVGEKAEVEGNITDMSTSSITVDQEGHGSFLCNVTSSTEIRHGNTQLKLSDLHTGDHVHVSGTGAGTANGQCMVNASEVKLQ